MFYEINHLGSPQYLKTEHGENFSFSSHLHQCFELLTVTKGEMQVKIDDSEFPLKKGEAVLIFPNQIHSLSSKKSKHSLCIFSPNLVKAFVKKTAETVPVCNKFTPEEYLLKAILKLTEASPHLEKKGLLYSLCAQFDKTARYKERNTRGDKIIHKIFSFVEDNFSGSCSLEDLAAATGYDYTYLSKLFKKTVGISFVNYVNHTRLSHACYLLENTDDSILSCSLECGYSSLRSFNRNFKIHFGITPKEYREQNKKA